MTKDNKVVMMSTTTHGYIYNVYPKDNLDHKKALYFGEISDNPKYNYCTCTGWSLLSKCYHNEFAHNTMEVKI